VRGASGGWVVEVEGGWGALGAGGVVYGAVTTYVDEETGGKREKERASVSGPGVRSFASMVSRGFERSRVGCYAASVAPGQGEGRGKKERRCVGAVGSRRRSAGVSGVASGRGRRLWRGWARSSPWRKKGGEGGEKVGRVLVVSWAWWGLPAFPGCRLAFVRPFRGVRTNMKKKKKKGGEGGGGEVTPPPVLTRAALTLSLPTG